MPKVIRLMDVYKYLPKTNCGKCGEPSCMAFAAKLVEREADIELCKPLFEPEYAEVLSKLLETIRPPVREVRFGAPPHVVRVGGKDVVFRHDLTWRNQTVIAVEVGDTLGDGDLVKQVKAIEGFSFERIGRELRLDAVALKNVSGDPERFAAAAAKVAETTQLPIVLCSRNAKSLEAALGKVGGRRPLLYAARRENWAEVAKLAVEYNCPLVVSSPGDLDTLVSLVKSIEESFDFHDLILDPGTSVAGQLMASVGIFSALRWAAVEAGVATVGFPLMAVPAAVWQLEAPDEEKAMMESILVSLSIAKYADLVVIRSIEPWSLLPIVVWRDCVYTDPRVPPSVKPGLYAIGSPNEKSPVLVTSNFALTFFLVKDDVKKASWTLGCSS